MENIMKPTSLEQLSQYAQGKLMELPEFAEGMPFYAYMRRPSMLDLIAQGKIPNPLAHTATSLFSKGGKGVDNTDPKQMKELTEILHIFCEASFVEPTYSQIKEAGLKLTDEQLMFVFNYVQMGTKALEKFRRQSTYTDPYGNSAKVEQVSVGSVENSR